MQSRVEILKDMIKSAKEEKTSGGFSYSAIMRHIRKNQPELVSEFMKTFKQAFDLGMSEDIPDIEQVALMEAIKTVGIEIEEDTNDTMAQVGLYEGVSTTFRSMPGLPALNYTGTEPYGAGYIL